MKPIETEFEMRNRKDCEAGAEPERKARNIDQGIDLIAVNIPPGYFQIVYQHASIFRRCAWRT